METTENEDWAAAYRPTEARPGEEMQPGPKVRNADIDPTWSISTCHVRTNAR